MSKRDLKKYLTELNKEQLEEQVLGLYEKFPAVKTYYDFVFNPKEDVLLKESRIKISNEYFPQNTSARARKPKMRRSVAQKYIKHFILLGVDPFLIGDIMLYSIEIAQTYSAERVISQESFFKSMFQSFDQAVKFMIFNGILDYFSSRINSIQQETVAQNWRNKQEFKAVLERL